MSISYAHLNNRALGQNLHADRSVVGACGLYPVDPVPVKNALRRQELIGHGGRDVSRHDVVQIGELAAMLRHLDIELDRNDKPAPVPPSLAQAMEPLADMAFEFLGFALSGQPTEIQGEEQGMGLAPPREAHGREVRWGTARPVPPVDAVSCEQPLLEVDEVKPPVLSPDLFRNVEESKQPFVRLLADIEAVAGVLVFVPAPGGPAKVGVVLDRVVEIETADAVPEALDADRQVVLMRL